MSLQFDVIAFLDSIGIEYKTSGKNVSRRDVNIRCIFCDDKSHHLGISKKSGIWRCWRCGRSGNFVSLVRYLLHINTWDEARRIAGQYLLRGELPIYSKEENRTTNLVIPPEYKPLYQKPKDPFLYQFWKKAVLYCKQRSVPLDLIFSWYYSRKGYILIPIYFNNRIVNYVCRAYLPKKVRYLNAPIDKVVVGIESLLYNIDSINSDWVILCEGIFDAIACGLDKSVAMFHKILTDKQVDLLVSKGIGKVYLCLDGDVAISDIRRNMYKLYFADIACEVIKLPRGYDPAGLPKKKLEMVVNNYV